MVKLAALVTDQMDDGKKILTTLGSSSHGDAINGHLEIEGYGGLGVMPESVFPYV